mgnify:CR=1 FL=1
MNNIHPVTLLQMGEWERERLRKHSVEIDFISSYRHESPSCQLHPLVIHRGGKYLLELITADVSVLCLRLLRKHSVEIDFISSYRHSMYYQKYLTDYLASFGKKDIAFEEVTEDFGKSYKAYLKKCKNFGASRTAVVPSAFVLLRLI